MIEYGTYLEAYNAKEALDGSDILGQSIGVDWCFVKGPKKYVFMRIFINLYLNLLYCRSGRRGRKSRRVVEDSGAELM